MTNVPGYTAATFTAGEQPTTTKWNYLWSNDAAFNAFLTATNNVITANMLDVAAITLGYAQITSTFATGSGGATQVTGLSIAVTIPAGSRRVKVTAFSLELYNATAASNTDMTIWDGTVGSGAQIGTARVTSGGANYGAPGMAVAIVSPPAGSKTYNVGLTNVGGSTANLSAAPTAPAFILVEAI